MEMVFLSLIGGIIIGHFWRSSRLKIKLAEIISYGGLAFLLLVMGARLGSDRELLAGLLKMGGQAAVLAALSIVGSVLMVQLASGYIQRKGNENKKVT